MHLEDRTFIISGGARGLGLATALLLLHHGAYVSILDVISAPNTIPVSAYSRTLFTKTDVTSSTSCKAALDATLTWIGSTGAPLSGLICCAGITGGSLALPQQPLDVSPHNAKYMNMKVFDEVYAVNVRGTVDLIRLTVPHMSTNEPLGPDNERGIVVVVSSVAAYEAPEGQFVYGSSKAAVSGLVLPLARELGQQAGIRVVGIAPTIFHTAMTAILRPTDNDKIALAEVHRNSKVAGPNRGLSSRINPEMVGYPARMGKPEEFARLVKEIVENPMLNGQVIRIDGATRFPSKM